MKEPICSSKKRYLDLWAGVHRPGGHGKPWLWLSGEKLNNTVNYLDRIKDDLCVLDKSSPGCHREKHIRFDADKHLEVQSCETKASFICEYASKSFKCFL